MSSKKSWGRIKQTGHFKRQVKINYFNIINSRQSIKNTSLDNEPSTSSEIVADSLLVKENESIPESVTIPSMTLQAADTIILPNHWSIELEDDNEILYDENNEQAKNETLRNELKTWSNKFNIKHNALKELMKILDQRLPNILPLDPRTFLNTVRTITLHQIGNSGQYWHQGFQFCIQRILNGIKEPINISINIGIDGLPTYKSSKDEFWPILFNIHEMPEINPMIIGLYCGKSKPDDLNAFLNPFVEEMKITLHEGIYINGYKISVKIRCFICDSPARAFVKGVAYFNGQHGCQKCTTVGEYSYISHTNFFSHIHCDKRTDEGFRSKIYGSHHKQDSPLLQLPIDMVLDFPIADSLHLIDLGIMKRCLLGWRDGSLGSYKTKWSARDTANISKFLLMCKMPVEIHRSIRGLDCLAHWKGLEFRTFLYYLGIVILKYFLPPDAYEHFLVLFCAITICSSEKYNLCLDLAHMLLEHYIEDYKNIYGKDYITSNVHNLIHLVDDVKKFGILTTFNTYPFESKLFHIKNMIRSGNKPLEQVAKRLSELNQIPIKKTPIERTKKIAIPKKQIIGYDLIGEKLVQNSSNVFFSEIKFNTFILNNKMENKWFLSKNGKIVAMKCVIQQNDILLIYGCSLKSINSYFETPIRSNKLKIFTSDCANTLGEYYTLDEIDCKLVAVPCNTNNQEVVFIPLLHTL